MLHIIYIAEACVPQVRSQCRKHRMRHGRLVDVGSTALWLQ
jgi:hypothetical protein